MNAGLGENQIGYAGDNAALAEGVAASSDSAANAGLKDGAAAGADGGAGFGAHPGAIPGAISDGQATAAETKASAIILTAVACAVAAWTIFDPRPYAMAVAMSAILPWFAVMLARRSRGMVGILPFKGDPRPKVGFALIAPAFAVGMRAMQDYHVLDWPRMLVMVLVVGGVLAAVTVFADVSLLTNARKLWLLVFLCGFWGYGTVLETDALLDGSPTAVYTAEVVGKHVSHGRSTSYYLALAPWGPAGAEGGDVSVAAKLFASVAVGDAVRLTVRSGALGVRWYVLEAQR
jgi:hypothetical protein